MSLQTEDCYFESYSDALKQAEKSVYLNRSKSKLQLCYYDGKAQTSSLPNLINLPLENFEETLLTLQTRQPTFIVHQQAQFVKDKLSLLHQRIAAKSEALKKLIRSQAINFHKPHRVYLNGEYMGRVVLKITELLKEAFIKAGYKVKFDINDKFSDMNDLRRLQSIAEFQPHITININRIRNDLINDSTFNFIWFMDPTLCLYDNSKFEYRERDHYFYLIDNFISPLLAKGVTRDRMTKQKFATNSDSFYLENKEQERKNKMVFIGNDYFHVGDPTSEYRHQAEMIDELSALFNEQKLDLVTINNLARKYKEKGTIRSQEHVEMFIFTAIVRLEVLKWAVNSNIELEIYGEGWENYQEFVPFYKGILETDDDVRRAYNASKYCLLAHPQYFYQQRLMEASACGAVPVVYKDVTNLEQCDHLDNILTFTNQAELNNIQDKQPRLDVQQIARDNSYEQLIRSIQEHVNDGLNNNINKLKVM
ncbi:hypothetical protein BM528_09860 [Alteromonas sp. RW2A1]|uniref:glycosyltransferase family protein n=1 Tax=Alteromonas sp. RW2A1 TaxID=1917158 RepID=UPI0009044EBA|nr:hypothetical protein [Alteromonas sp. RW2A1]APE06030.1 hypothetical protein BM528_09860 [Alteromonas sp. RW2A1]